MEDTAHRAVAIVGVGAILPDAPDVAAFWDNLLGGRYSISDVPTERWDPDWYYDPDPAAPDKTYSKIGGWVRDYPWDPMAWRMPIPPKVADAMDPAQRWAVSCTREVLTDYGWPERPLEPERTAVIIGNAMAGEKHYRTALRVDFPVFADELRGSSHFQQLPPEVQAAIIDEALAGLREDIPDITEDTMPGELANIIAGRVANLFDLHGPNFVTDAACASAMAAMDAAIDGLEEDEFDAVITGGIDRNMGAATFVKFCKIGALSATGTRPYAEGADGFVMGEGAALFLLKRLADAERDGDRIYAVIRGIGGASDGKGKGITAPNPVGQRLAVERAWRIAGLDPATATYMEGHGTSTKVGDVVEHEGLAEVLRAAGARPGSVGLGSVKSNIGHLKGAAGAAGILKTVLALHHRELPPSLGFVRPNPDIDFADSPLRVVDERRPWEPNGDGVRRAGVSAFGFGGTNFHVVLEEYVPGRLDPRPPGRAGADTGATAVGASTSIPAGPAPTGAPAGKAPLRGAVLVGGATDAEVVRRLRDLAERAGAGHAPQPAPPADEDLTAPVRVALDFGDATELATRATKAADALEAGTEAAWRVLGNQGVFLGRGAPAKVAFLYTGQGSQYVNMLAELRDVEPIVADAFAEADRVMTPLLDGPLSSVIFTDDPDAVPALEEHLKQTEITQPAVLTADLALTHLLAAYGIAPDMVMGHSLGEYGALVAAGSLTFDAALEAVSARGREMADLSVDDNGAMAAVMAPLAEIERIVDEVDGYVVVANVNSAHQAVIGGATAAVEAAVEACKAAGHTAMRIPVSHAFHTSIVAPATEPLREALHRLDVREPALPIVANVTGEFYPSGGEGDERMLDLLGRQVASPVQFVKGLETLYDAGARVFVEVGPKRALHGFAEDVLGDRGDVVSLFTNHPKQGAVVAFNRALVGLWAAGHGAPAPAAPARTPAPASVTSTAGAPAPAVSGSGPTGTLAPAPAPTVSSGAADDGTYLELGRLFAEFLDRGRQLYPGGTAADGDGTGRVPVVITGAGLGLPGTEHRFEDDAVRRILDGEQFIDQIPSRARNGMVDKHIVRLVKSDTADPVFEQIGTADDVIKLAGRGGALDLTAEFGVEPERVAAFDTATQLAVGAGLLALRDAGIPLVMHYKTTSVGSRLPERWMLPDEMRDDTGVIFASAFPGYDALVGELDRYHRDRTAREKLQVLEHLRSRVGDGDAIAAELDHEIHELRADLEHEPFEFDRAFLFRILAMGHSQFAELIGARGPNTHVNAACASTTQAIALAEDWIRAGRCRRVVVVAGDDASSDHLIGWIGSGFLASGAAATDGVVEDAALPFDNRRHGMILGMGAAALVVEHPGAAAERGVGPICEVLGAVTANSAFHGTRLDVDHIGQVMEDVVRQAEARGFARADLAPETVFVSHETYTPARGGSASAEINALRRVFGPAADRIVIANTKGFTGHPMGVGIEDVVAVKALETGIVPPVPNFREIDPALGDLHLSKGGAYPVRYALRLAAGFGSQISMVLLRWTPPADGRHREPDELGYEYRVRPDVWSAWLRRVGGPGAEVEVVQHRLRVVDRGPAAAPSAPPVPAPGVEPAAPAPAAPAAPAPAAPAPAADVPGAGVPAADVPAPAGDVPAGDVVVARVLAEVSAATGYPSDMLDLDLDLEADLGIDTVKQAEVFGAIRESFGIERDEQLRLRDYPTLGHVIGFVRDRARLDGSEVSDAAGASAAASDAPVVPTHVAAAPPEGHRAAADAVSRRAPVPVLRPDLDRCVATGVELGDGSRVVIGADGGGVAEALRDLLVARGVDVLLVEGAPTADELVALVDGWRGDQPVTGLYWLPALDPEPSLAELDLAGWRDATRVRVKLLYAVLRHLGDDIGDTGTFAVGGTRLGGQHGYGAGGATAPMGGAVTGFLKAFARERTDALVKAVDVAVGEPAGAVAARLLAETERDPGCVEVGHRPSGGDGDGAGDRRLAITVQPQVDPPAGSGLTLDDDSVFVVTGAAGSIVSAITADLARHSGGTFYLLDLTPEPDPADEDLRRFTADRDGLKREVFERLKASGERATPAMVDRELARLERLEAAQAAIEAIADAGGRAHYRSVDLTDADAVAAVVDEVRDAHGRVDVLLHAAGVEVSHFLPDKEPREFDLVFDVKCDGWFNLLHALGDLPLGATVVFSSVAGRFGNGGQVDYSAANDLLCKHTAMLGATRPGTLAVALDWTAWAGIGMAARGSIPKMMAMAGIEMLDPEAGIAMVRRQLEVGAAGEAVVGGALGLLVAERHSTGGLDPTSLDAPADAGPMVGDVVRMGVYSGLEVVTTLDPADQPFLHDHRIEGTPVLPGVMGMEAFAEVAALTVPGLVVASVEDVSFLAPFKYYRDEPRAVTVRAHPTVDDDEGDGDAVVVRCELVGHRRLPGQDEDQETVHFTGTVCLVPADRAPGAEEAGPPPPEVGRVVTADELYRVYFHGDAYRVLDRVWRAGEVVVGRLDDDLPPNHRPPELPLALAPRLVEACFQTAGTWDIGRKGELGLPTAVGRVTVPAAPAPGPGPRFTVVRPADDGTFDAVVVDADGHVLVLLEGYRTTTLPGGLADDEVAPFREAMS
jgi:acyl transferase domain-containing protein/NAD(P)-dependent dehydrogenase (short-subunit alcohol dehydrogenase family)